MKKLLQVYNNAQFWTVTALILAVSQTCMAFMAQLEAEKQAENLKLIEGSLSTRYLGVFPEYITDIAQLIEKTESKLDLFYDVPGYGAFSDYLSWLEMRQAIERKMALDLSITIALYSPALRREVLEEQFIGKSDQWSNWIKSPKIAKKINNYLKRNGYKESADNFTNQRYVEISMEVQEKIFNEIFGHTKVSLINELMPIYFWISDDRKAIFVIPSFSENSSEFAFYTHDSNIIDALTKMRDRYINRIQE